jgi:alpha-mannosidase
MPESAPLPTRAFYIVGVTHIDLAWKRGPAEMTEMLEILAIRLLDALESEPDFRYMLEQAAHYRTLARTRPDLVERLKRYVQEGRLEFVGGMASTLDTNLPNGESFVRNQALGMQWVRENFGVSIQTGWLFDTFGINAQVPQILQQFGLTTLMANRFGGATFHDIFRARGLDGSEVLVVGRESYSAYVRRENTLRVFYHNWDGIDRLFREADDLPGDGPLLLIPYVENEYLLSLRPLRIAEERNAERPQEQYRMATPGDYFAALEKTGHEWPVLHRVSGGHKRLRRCGADSLPCPESRAGNTSARPPRPRHPRGIL